ncbi:MAG: cadmium-translocating P-type ATPase [Pirellulales bacterium]|nr:cadmium-translocating P-type ATPase [Pirellulales bacterium]
MAKIRLKIIGMDCAEEVAVLKAELMPVSGVQELAFDILHGTVTVTYADGHLEPNDLIRAVSRTGMRADIFNESNLAAPNETTWQHRSRIATTAMSGLFIATGFFVHAIAVGWKTAFGEHGTVSIPVIAQGFYLLAIFAGAWFVLPKAWIALRRIRPDMNLLMVVAIAGAIFIGEWFEAATVSFLFALSLALEGWSVGRARRAIAALMQMTPPQARVVGDDGTETMIAVESVPVGSRLLVKPGERIPLDGTVFTGQTAINQAPITGESMPVSKTVGDEVFAGTINQDGAIEIIASKTAGETTLAHIIQLVQEAQSKRSPSEQWVEKFARYYTPAVMSLAIAVALIPPLMGGSWSQWFYEGLVLLVIACPCALVISTPVSIVASLAAAAKHGVLIKGGMYVELPARIRAIALDKTGTLTEGRPEVTRIIPLSGHNEAELLRIAAAIELRSEHPLAKAVVRHAAKLGINPEAVDTYQAVKGKGATASMSGRAVWIGSHRYLEERGEETAEMHQWMEEISADGNSVVVVGEDGHVCGIIALADRVRQNARTAILDMKAAGIGHVVMLTGDNRPTAQAIARITAMDEFHAELLPQDKIAAIDDLVREHGIVGMVGDGVNDAPALARANLGIAMGAVGTDAAMETADIVLMTDDLSRLPWLVRHSRRTLRIIRQNIFASLTVKAMFVVLTLFGHASLWAAIAADMGISLLVVFNALRLLRG